ncbi:MAG TPA: cytochrome P450 [Pyrinomonadaceae bacterium]|nr:cytochrome P450 [Pyrinomonadaceae bacterium]
MAANVSPLVPRVPGRLLTGVMPEFTRDSLAFVVKVAREYGDVARARFLYLDAYFLSHPDLIERALVTENRSFIKARAVRSPFFAGIVGQGLLTSEGDFWRRQRRLAQPAFHRERISSYAAEMTDSTERLIRGWRDNETRDLHEDMQRLTMEIVTRTLFSAEISDADAETIWDALAEIARPFSRQATLKWIADNRLPTAAHRRFFRNVARLDEVVFRIIAARRESGEDRGDLLSMLLAAQDEDGASMNDRQLRDEVMTIFLAGQETTALALTWAWHLLAENPSAESALHAELDEVLEGGGSARFEDLPRLRYAEAVVKESMRLYPPAWGVGREAARECEIGGYRIPKGAQVFMMSYAVQRDPRFFRDPESFRPERWTNGETDDLPKFAYFPFGGGPRVCIGNSFAMTETVICLATIARRFSFRHAPGHAVAPLPAMSLRLSDGLKVVVARR